MKMLIEKTDGVPILYHLRLMMNGMPDGKYMVDVRRQHNKRSLNQNEWLWGSVYPILLDGLIDAGWEFTTTEQVHEFFKRLYANEKIVNRDSGEIVEIPQSTASMDTQQFSAYIDKLRDYASEYLNVSIPCADKLWRQR